MPIFKYQPLYDYAVQLHGAFTALSADGGPDASARFGEDGKDPLTGPTGARGMSAVR